MTRGVELRTAWPALRRGIPAEEADLHLSAFGPTYRPLWARGFLVCEIILLMSGLTMPIRLSSIQYRGVEGELGVVICVLPTGSRTKEESLI